MRSCADGAPVTHGARCSVGVRDAPTRWNGMPKSDYKLSRAHGPMRGATGCGRGVGGLPPTWEGRDLALARSARHSARRALSERRGRGGATVACRHAPRTTLSAHRERRDNGRLPPCAQDDAIGCHPTSNARLHADRTHARRFGRAGGKGYTGTQVQRVRAKAQALIPSQARPLPRAPGGDASGGPEGGALRATPAGRAHPSVRSRSGG